MFGQLGLDIIGDVFSVEQQFQLAVGSERGHCEGGGGWK